jgi:hypothetical protein
MFCYQIELAGSFGMLYSLYFQVAVTKYLLSTPQIGEVTDAARTLTAPAAGGAVFFLFPPTLFVLLLSNWTRRTEPLALKTSLCQNC